MSGLLDCPFCGSQPSLHGHHAPEFWVMCDTIGCKATTEAFGSQERAIAAWNTRATPDLTKEVERLREALGKIASCIKHTDGDVVDIARQALNPPKEPQP